ncbi:IS30 family transposase [Thiohalophilus sp.]|uniref:IS30 family transposase n=1 Tax=Thiohalophilus sp. TaxID=3028392 RepID=UPI002ACEACB8|nr:IS30 family transposase [Thiohalophilus sp.]MDZ7803481.1 IS30 family transposase [Thiohalophilus sp.]
MRHYTQLTLEQRYQIQAYMKAGFNETQTADFIGVDKSTVNRELRRNRGKRGYRAKQAHRRCLQRRADKARSRIDNATWRHVRRLLREDWSPEQICLWLAQETAQSVSCEHIYQYVLADKRSGGSLYRHLRCQKQRKKRYGTYSRRGQIPHQISIDQRPAVVDSRRRYGDWELDTVIGKNHRQALVTLVERKSKLTLIAKVARKTAEAVSEAIIRLLKPLAPWVHTLTADNGREFAQHQKIARALNAKFYFAHPFASWERGLNENTNGLIRQYFPKKHDFTTITQKQIERVMEKLNNRPRKCLGIKTPNQVFFGIHPDVALAT